MAFYSQFVHYYDTIFPFKQATFDFLQSYIAPDKTSVLDVGCGTGHYTAAFAAAGFQATGIDLDVAMIDYAQTYCNTADFYALNMLDIDSLNQKYDLIFCIGNTLAHLKLDELVAFLPTVRAMLNPGGRWIFQVRNWDYVRQHKKYNFPLLRADHGRVQFSRSYTEITAHSLQFNTRLTDADTLVFADQVTMTPLSAQEYSKVHQDLSFKLSGQFGDFQRTPFEPNRDSSLVFVFTI